MHQLSRRALAAASVAVVLALSACGSSEDAHSGSMTSGSGDTHSSKSTSSSGAQGDVEFAQMMIPHHEQAVEMADLALRNASASSDVKALASQIKAAQDPEIEKMKGWLGQWGAAESAGPMAHGSGGMQDEDDMAALEAADGPEFDRMWLTMMIAHHEGAVTMAQDVLDTTSDADVRLLATAVVEGQKKEIATMKGMLG